MLDVQTSEKRGSKVCPNASEVPKVAERFLDRRNTNIMMDVHYGNISDLPDLQANGFPFNPLLFNGTAIEGIGKFYSNAFDNQLEEQRARNFHPSLGRHPKIVEAFA